MGLKKVYIENIHQIWSHNDYDPKFGICFLYTPFLRPIQFGMWLQIHGSYGPECNLAAPDRAIGRSNSMEGPQSTSFKGPF